MTMTPEKIAGLLESCENGIARITREDLVSLLALAERALEPQGQALDDMYDAIEDTPEAAATFWREEPEPGMPLAVERFTWHLKVQVPPGRANFENLFTARQMIAHGRKCWEAGRASQLALPAGPVHECWKLLPKVPDEAMLNAARDWSVKKYGIGVGNDGAIGCYGAMYDAAPQPTAPSPAVAQPVADERVIGHLLPCVHELTQTVIDGQRYCFSGAKELSGHPELRAKAIKLYARAALSQPAEEGDKV